MSKNAVQLKREDGEQREMCMPKELGSAHCMTMTFALKRLRARMLGPLSSR